MTEHHAHMRVGDDGDTASEHETQDNDASMMHLLSGDDGDASLDDEDSGSAISDDDDSASQSSMRHSNDLQHPLEDVVQQLARDVTTLSTPLQDDGLAAKLNTIAEALEDAEASFRKERMSPYRREGHLIGNLLHHLDQNHDFYPTIEAKLTEVTASRVKAAVCRVLLATVPMHSRFIIRLLYDEEMLERMCEYTSDADPHLRCYATGLLAVGLRDRSIADIVVNRDTPLKLLKRARLFASKLERERHVALKYMCEHLRSSAARQKRGNGGSSSKAAATASGSASKSVIGLKRKLSESNVRASADESVVLPNDAADGGSSIEAEDAGADTSIGDALSLSLPQISSADDNDDRGGMDETTTSSTDAVAVAVDGSNSDHHEEDLKRLVLLELLHTLDCIGSMGEYLELFAPAHREDIIGTIVTFLHSKNPTVLSHTMKLTSHFLAHKKFASSFIEAGGVALVFAVAKSQQAAGQIGLLDRSLSMCLHGLASSSIVVEKILTADADSLLEVAFSLLSSPNDRARQNAVVFFGLTLPFKAILEYFETHNGLYTLLNVIRAGNNPKSAAQRQLSHDACLCLRQYLRAHLALVVHRLRRRLAQATHPSHANRTSATTAAATASLSTFSAAPAAVRLPARVPKLSWLKPIDVDDKAHEQNVIFYEKHRYSVTGTNGAWSAAVGPGGSMWPPAAKLVHLRGILVMLEVTAMMCAYIQSADPDDSSSATRIWSVERSQFCLESLRVLTLVVPALAIDVCATETVLDDTSGAVGGTKRPGISLLLELAASTNARDSDLVRDALRVLCQCVSPPHAEDCWQHPYKDIRQFTLTARSMRSRTEVPSGSGSNATAGGDSIDNSVAASSTDTNSTLLCCARSKDDRVLRPVRRLAREKNAIKVCVQLLRYKRSVQNADAVRLLATRVLLGLSRDKQIAQILEKMQLSQLLSDLIRNEPMLEENADLHVRFRESALDLISQVTHRAPNAVINEATDPTVRKIEKASIVAQTKIAYDDDELLRLIHDHLVAKGLERAASALVDDAQLATDATGRASPSTALRVDSVASAAPLGKQSPRMSKSRTNTDACSFAAAATASNGDDDLRRPAKIARIAYSASQVDPALAHHVDVLTAGAKVPAAVTPHAPTVPLRATGSGGAGALATPGQRRKRVKAALTSPHYFASRARALKSATSRWPSDVGHAATPPSAKSPAVPRAGGAHSGGLILGSHGHHESRSKLDEIITHYLREQHRQCANPVATIPPFKLLGRDAMHRCPDPPSAAAPRLSICARLLRRDRVGERQGTRAFASPYTDAGVNRYVFSRYRPYRTLAAHAGEDWGGVSVAQFYGKDQRDVLMGSHEGELRLVNIDTDSVVEQWSCHAESSAIVALETNENTRMGTQNRLLLTGSAALSAFGTTEIALWDVANMTSARWRFDAAVSPQFNHYGDRVVALDGRASALDDELDGRRGVHGALVLDIATGDVVCELNDRTRSNEYGLETNCCFSPCDGTILTDGMLWDARLPTRALYKFDKLSNVGYGFFHPGGNEVIINSAVWDLRTYKLLRMVPALDKCSVKFNSVGSILYAFYPYAGGDDLGRRRSKLKTWFRVLDSREYKDISTIELERPIFDLAIDAKSSLLSVVEGRYVDSDDQDDSVCRLYDIGRKKPSEDDSDVEDTHDDADALDDDEFDDESETSEGEDTGDESGDDVFGSDIEIEIIEDSESEDNGSDEDDDSESDASGLSGRSIRFLAELPDDGDYYDSSDEEEEDGDEE